MVRLIRVLFSRTINLQVRSLIFGLIAEGKYEEAIPFIEAAERKYYEPQH